MNKAESAALERDLQANGFSPAAGPQSADVVLLNTCAVRKTAEDRIWGRLGFYRHLKKERPFTLAVLGCMSERLKENLSAAAPEVDVVIGTFGKRELVERLQGQNPAPTPAEEAEIYHFAPLHSLGATKALLPVMHGCDNFCSYCIVPHVRGRERSRAPAEILAEIAVLEREGAREVTLLGQNVNSYRYSEDGREILFPDLLDMIEERLVKIRWVRFLTSHPKDCSAALIERLCSSSVLCPHLHLPVQHGSNRILSLMNRGYTREQYLALIDAVKMKVSDISITTDILIGFPTETEDDLAATVSLMEEVGFDDAYTYYYNPREGTRAYDFGDTVGQKEKLARLGTVIEVGRRLKAERLAERIGKKARVLVEGTSRKAAHELLGRTEHDEMVVFPGGRELIGGFVDVILQSLNGTTFRGQLCT